MDRDSMNKLIGFSLIIALFLGCKPEYIPEDLPSIEGKRILMVYGGWEGHQPDKFTKRVADWLKVEGAIVTLSDSLGVYTNKEIMNSTDLIIQYWTMGEITNEQFIGLEQAIKNGVGLAGVHGGIGDSFRQNPEYQYIIGGQWVHHPGGVIEKFKVHIFNDEDPVTYGVSDFDMNKTEQYYMHIDPNTKVLATTSFTDEHHSWIEGRTIPVAWKTNYDKGRVFYLSLGHFPTDFDTPEAWTLLSRGIKWASGSKYLPKERTLDPLYK